MTTSVIDMLARPLIFARITASASAAAARALADGRPVGLWQSGVLFRQHPDGSRVRSPEPEGAREQDGKQERL